MANESMDTTNILLRFQPADHGTASKENYSGGAFSPGKSNYFWTIKQPQIKESAREGVLRRYQRAVRRQLERGDTVPMKLSEFLAPKR